MTPLELAEWLDPGSPLWAAMPGYTRRMGEIASALRDQAAEIERLREESRQWGKDGLVALVTERGTLRARLAEIMAAWDRICSNRGWLSCHQAHDLRCERLMHLDGCVCGADQFRRLMEE